MQDGVLKEPRRGQSAEDKGQQVNTRNYLNPYPGFYIKMTKVNELREELLNEEVEGCLMGSGDDMYYVEQIREWFKQEKLIDKVLQKGIDYGRQSKIKEELEDKE